MLAVVAMSYEAEATNQDQGPLTKHQKLSMVRQASTFSFEDLTKLNICKMTYYRKRTPSERELIAKKLRHSSLGKRKPRRAIRRRAISKGPAGPERLGSVANTSVGSPRVISTAGSICGESICGVSTGLGGGTTVVTAAGGVSPTCSMPPATITVPPTSCSILKDTSGGAISPRPGSAGAKRGSSPALDMMNPGGTGQAVTLSTVKERRKRSSSSGSSGPVIKPRRLKHRAGVKSVTTHGAQPGTSRPLSGDSRLTTATDNSGGGSSGVAGDVSNTTTSASLAPVGGVRVSGRVKVVSGEDGDRFILDTGDGESDMNLGDAIFSLLGLRVNMAPEEMKKLGSMNSVTGSILVDNTLSKELVEVDVTGDETGAVAIDIGEPGAQPAVVVSPPPPDPDEDGTAAGSLVGDGAGDENGSDIASICSGEVDATTALATKNGEVTKVRGIMRGLRKFSLVLKTRLKPIVNHCLFEAFITICIICNTILLAMEHHGQTVELEEWLKKGNNVSDEHIKMIMNHAT